MTDASTCNTRRHTTRLVATVLVFVVTGVTSSAVPASAQGSSRSAAVLRIAAPDALGASTGGIHLDPVKSTTAEVDYPYQVLFYDGLLRRTPGGGFAPDLATKATIVDPQTIDVELRDGVVFSDGAPFDADAVKAGVERNHANSTSQFQAEFAALQDITVNGPRSLRITLNQPVAGAFYRLLAGPEFFVPSPKAIRDGVDLDQHPVGAGAFVLDSFAPGQKLETTKNPKYFDAKNVKFRGVEYIGVLAGPQTLNLLKTGGADFGFISVSDAATMRSSGFSVKTQGSDDQMYWMPICKTTKPLDDPKVRQALNYAVDRDALNQAIFDGAGEPQWALWPSANDLFPQDLDNVYKYNPAKAKKLLADAGYPNGFSTSVMITASPTIQTMAEVVQSDWAKIGVKLDIRTSSNYVQDLFSEQKADMGISPQIRSGLSHLTGPFVPGSIGDLCNYSNPALNSIADQLKSLAPGDPKTVELWKQAQDFVVKDQALGIFGLFGPIVTAWNPKTVKNVQLITGPVNYPDYWRAAPK